MDVLLLTEIQAPYISTICIEISPLHALSYSLPLTCMAELYVSIRFSSTFCICTLYMTISILKSTKLYNGYIKPGLYLLGPPLHNYQSTVLLCMFVHAVIPVAYIVEPYIVSNAMCDFCNLMVIHTLYIQFIQSMWLAQWSLSRSKYIHKPNNNSGN